MVDVSTLTVGLTVASYAAFLGLIGYLGRGIMQARRRETAREAQVRRRVRNLRRAQARVEARLDTITAELRRLPSLAEDLAVLVHEVEALQSWQAAELAKSNRRGGAG